MLTPPPRRSIYKKRVSIPVKPLQIEEESNVAINNVDIDSQNNQESLPLMDQINKLKCENEALKKQLKEARIACNAALQEENLELRLKKDKLAKFLNQDQIKLLEENRLNQWSNESIIKGLKFRYALSVHGFDFLRKSGYPLPSYSTIMRKIQEIKLNFGIFKDVLELLQFKVESMDATDKFCVLSYDEMCISEQLDYDKSSGQFSGYATLGANPSLLGQKIFVVLVRGIKNRWKQVIACHVTRKESIDHNEVKNFILDCISSVEKCGLSVLLLSSDLDGRNRSLWTSLQISATKYGRRVNSFDFNGHEIYVSPDVCHLLKNLKSAVLRQKVYLPNEFIEMEDLPTNVVDGTHIVQLWKYEISNVGAKRLLHHLKIQDIEPSNFDKMNVGAAVRFFSTKTASAIQTAVELQILPKEALTTAAFILIVEKWFSITASKSRKTSITSRNCDQKYIFLHTVIDLFQNTVFQEGWKPLNYGFVLATLSFCDLAEYLFTKNFDFILGDRFTQDGTENVFSQIRKKEGKMPSALKSLRAIKGISVSQFVSDCKRTSYSNDSDIFLLDFCSKKRKVNRKSSVEKESIELPTKKKELVILV